MNFLTNEPIAVSVTMYLPAGYSATAEPYPFLIFLHGCCGDDNSTSRQNTVPPLNSLIAAGEISPLLVAWVSIPDGPFGNRHSWMDSERNGEYGSVIVEDVLDWISANYNASTERRYHAIGGFSTGAEGAMRLAVRHTDKFAAGIAQSGAIAVDHYEIWRDEVLNESGGAPPYTYNPGGLFSGEFFGNASVFSPNLNSNFYQLDFPLDENGEWIPAIFEEKWIKQNDPARLIDSFRVSVPDYMIPAIYFDAGTVGFENQYLKPFSDRFEELLTERSIPHTYNNFASNHVITEERSEAMLRWLHSVFSLASPVTDIKDQPFEVQYLNPVSEEAQLHLSVAVGGFVSIEVVDLNGRIVDAVTKGKMEQGDYTFNWTAGLLSGLHFYRVEVGKHTVLFPVLFF